MGLDRPESRVKCLSGASSIETPMRFTSSFHVPRNLFTETSDRIDFDFQALFSFGDANLTTFALFVHNRIRTMVFFRSPQCWTCAESSARVVNLWGLDQSAEPKELG